MLALAGERSELPGHRRQHAGFNNCVEGGLALTCLLIVTHARGARRCDAGAGGRAQRATGSSPTARRFQQLR